MSRLENVKSIVMGPWKQLGDLYPEVSNKIQRYLHRMGTEGLLLNNLTGWNNNGNVGTSINFKCLGFVDGRYNCWTWREDNGAENGKVNEGDVGEINTKRVALQGNDDGESKSKGKSKQKEPSTKSSNDKLASKKKKKPSRQNNDEDSNTKDKPKKAAKAKQSSNDKLATDAPAKHLKRTRDYDTDDEEDDDSPSMPITFPTLVRATAMNIDKKCKAVVNVDDVKHSILFNSKGVGRKKIPLPPTAFPLLEDCKEKRDYAKLGVTYQSI